MSDAVASVARRGGTSRIDGPGSVAAVVCSSIAR